MTVKLYWDDSHLTQFSARVVEVDLTSNTLVLDRTAFYPTGGGQPHDTGTIGDVQVRDVTTGDDGHILHVVDDASSFAAGVAVECTVDWPRRRELMQQHTGQHILSQAFFQLFGAETRGFRLNDRVAEIDLALDLSSAAIAAAITQAEDLANQIVFDDREVRSHQVTPEEAARLPLRKESLVEDCVRVVEIADFDWSPCGGTHARRTGEVGLIAVRRCERAKRMTRVEFVCGVRALQDYRTANSVASDVAARFSGAREQAVEAVTRLMDENKRLQRRVRELSELAAKAEAEELLKAADLKSGTRVVKAVFNDRSFEEIKLLAHRLAAYSSVVALLAARDENLVRLVFARSAGLEANMGALMKLACERLGGKGGGTPDFAQGGGSRMDELEAVFGEVAGGI